MTSNAVGLLQLFGHGFEPGPEGNAWLHVEDSGAAAWGQHRKELGAWC